MKLFTHLKRQLVCVIGIMSVGIGTPGLVWGGIKCYDDHPNPIKITPYKYPTLSSDHSLNVDTYGTSTSQNTLLYLNGGSNSHIHMRCQKVSDTRDKKLINETFPGSLYLQDGKGLHFPIPNKSDYVLVMSNVRTDFYLDDDSQNEQEFRQESIDNLPLNTNFTIVQKERPSIHLHKTNKVDLTENTFIENDIHIPQIEHKFSINTVEGEKTLFHYQTIPTTLKYRLAGCYLQNKTTTVTFNDNAPIPLSQFNDNGSIRQDFSIDLQCYGNASGYNTINFLATMKVLDKNNFENGMLVAKTEGDQKSNNLGILLNYLGAEHTSENISIQPNTAFQLFESKRILNAPMENAQRVLLNFAAILKPIQNGVSITPGKFTATANFEIEYK